MAIQYAVYISDFNGIQNITHNYVNKEFSRWLIGVYNIFIYQYIYIYIILATTDFKMDKS